VTRTALPVVALAVLVPVLLLTSCSDGSVSDGGAAATASPASPASPASTPSPTATAAALQELPAFSVGPNGVIADVTTDVCEAGPGRATASGTATNSGRFERDVVVVVSWVAAQSSDVVARAVDRVEDLPPGQSRDWSLSAEVPAGDGLLCVPTAYAGQLAAP